MIRNGRPRDVVARHLTSALVGAVILLGACGDGSPLGVGPLDVIAYVAATDNSAYRIEVSAGDGERLIARTGPDRESNPRWSPDGRQLAFVRIADGASQVWLMNADGTARVQLTHDAQSAAEPSWSPDGQRIAFNRYTATATEMWTMRADGTDARRIGTGFSPEWGPDDHVAFWNTEAEGSHPGIFLLDLGTGAVRRVTPDSAGIVPWTARFSRDGRLAYIRERLGARDGVHFQEWSVDVYDARSGRTRTHYTQSRPLYEVTWSPTSAEFLLTRPVDGPADLWIVRTDGSNLRRLPDAPGAGATRERYDADWRPAR